METAPHKTETSNNDLQEANNDLYNKLAERDATIEILQTDLRAKNSEIDTQKNINTNITAELKQYTRDLKDKSELFDLARASNGKALDQYKEKLATAKKEQETVAACFKDAQADADHLKRQRNGQFAARQELQRKLDGAHTEHAALVQQLNEYKAKDDVYKEAQVFINAIEQEFTTVFEEMGADLNPENILNHFRELQNVANQPRPKANRKVSMAEEMGGSDTESKDGLDDDDDLNGGPQQFTEEELAEAATAKTQSTFNHEKNAAMLEKYKPKDKSSAPIPADPVFDFEKEFKDALERSKELEAKLEAANTRIAELKHAEARLKTAEKDLQDQKDSLRDCEAELTETENRLDGVETELNHVRGELKNVQGELKIAKDALKDIEAEQEEAEDEIDRLTARGEKLEREVKTLKAKGEESESEIEKLSTDLEDSQSELDNTSVELEKVKRESWSATSKAQKYEKLSDELLQREDDRRKRNTEEYKRNQQTRVAKIVEQKQETIATVKRDAAAALAAEKEKAAKELLIEKEKAEKIRIAKEEKAAKDRAAEKELADAEKKHQIERRATEIAAKNPVYVDVVRQKTTMEWFLDAPFWWQCILSFLLLALVMGTISVWMERHAWLTANSFAMDHVRAAMANPGTFTPSPLKLWFEDLIGFDRRMLG